MYTYEYRPYNIIMNTDIADSTATVYATVLLYYVIKFGKRF